MATTTYHTADIRNVAFAGHGASGKTSLIDAFLFAAGATNRKGSVDDGTSVCDTDEEEKRRKYSIDCHLLHCRWQSKELHLIDSPGYPDFIGNALSALAAAENVVIAVNAGHGPEVNTRRLFQEAAALGLGRVIALTKMDADNVDYVKDLEIVRESFGKQCVPFNVPIGQGASFSGIVSVLDPPGKIAGATPLDPKDAYQMVVEAIVETNEDLTARYLDGETISHEELEHAAHDALAVGAIVPIVCVSTKKDIGVRELMDLIVHCGLAPNDLKHMAVRGDEEIPVLTAEDGEVIAQVFKTANDMFMGKMSYLKILSGKLSKDATLVNLRTGKTSKPGHLYMLQGNAKEEVGEAIAGDIVAVAKFDDLKVSDTVTISHAGAANANGNTALLKPIAFPQPMFPRAVEPKTREDEAKISVNLAKIADEDPTFTYRRDQQTHELVMSGMSELHLEVIQSRLKNRYKLEVNTHIPHVPYLETIAGLAEAHYRHKKQTGGRGQFGDVHIRVRPLPRGEGFRFVDAIKGGVIPGQYIPAVEKGVREQMEKGVISGNKVVDVEVELFFGSYHEVDSSEQAFKTAASHAFRKAFTDAKPIMLEPTVNIEIVVPIEKFGDISADLSTRRGQIQGMDVLPGNLQSIKGIVPLSEVLSYATTLKSMTGGRGSYSMEFKTYDMVPANIQAKLVEKYQKSRTGVEEES